MTSQIIPTRETAVKVLEILSHGLTHGLGKRVPGKFCVEAAVCFALGLPHGDDPQCVAPAVRLFKITLNDSSWSSNTARANGLRRLAIAQLGSVNIDQPIFVKEVTHFAIRTIVPIALRAAVRLHPDQKHNDAMEATAVKCETCGAAAADAAAAAAAAADADTRDEVLGLMAEAGVQALILCKSPGCEWLDLCPLEQTK